MTNATVASVAGVHGEDLTLTYRGGESKIKVTPRTRIVTFQPGNAHDLKPATISSPSRSRTDKALMSPLSISIGRGGLYASRCGASISRRAAAPPRRRRA